jgi:hypothetical protein
LWLELATVATPNRDVDENRGPTNNSHCLSTLVSVTLFAITGFGRAAIGRSLVR